MEQEIDYTKLAGEVLNRGNIGLWIIELEDAEEPRMYGDGNMHRLLCAKDGCTAEEMYNAWYNNVHENSYDSVDAAVEQMIEGKHAEVTYPWFDKYKKTYIYIRCGGVAVKNEDGIIRIEGYHQDITSESDKEVLDLSVVSQLKLENMQKESAEQMKMLLSVANVYYSLHYINLELDTVSEYVASSQIKHWIKEGDGATRKMINVMANTVKAQCVEDALRFTDLTTIAQRMKGKADLVETLEGEFIGWFDAEFIAVEQNPDLTPKTVIFATKVVDEQKTKEERLIRLSHTDGLTGINNRRSYEERILEINGVPGEQNFVVLSVDVNGLKQINDNIGHDAGDEVIIAVANILDEFFSKYGSVYRMGGDEFVAILSVEPDRLSISLDECKSRIDAWTGKLVSNISASFGCASKQEFSDMSVQEMAKVADKRMYEAKSAYYVATGKDRRRR